MDIATLCGIFAGAFLVFFAIAQGGGLSTFVNPGAMAITMGGTFAATLVSFPLSQVLGVFAITKNAFLHKVQPIQREIDLIVDLAQRARRDGLLSLESGLARVNEDFLRKGIQLTVDGLAPDMMKNILNTELTKLEERHRMGQDILSTMGTYAPAFGMIGTLIGLVAMLQSLEDPTNIGPAMAVALITTFYGALMANLIFLPLAGKLRVISEAEVLRKEMFIEGILAIQAGNNPRVIKEKLTIFVAPKLRAQVK